MFIKVKKLIKLLRYNGKFEVPSLYLNKNTY